MTARDRFVLRTGLPYVRYRGLKSASAPASERCWHIRGILCGGNSFHSPPTPSILLLCFCLYFNVFRSFKTKYVTTVYSPILFLFIYIYIYILYYLSVPPPQWGAADAEIKVPFGENTELERSPRKAWSRSVFSHTCYAYCQGFLACLFLHFRSIHLHFSQNLPRFFPVLAVANTWFLCRPTE